MTTGEPGMSLHELTVQWPAFFRARQRERDRQAEKDKQRSRTLG